MRTIVVATLTLLYLVTPVQAGIYKCGNIYQDRPCDGSAAPPPAAPNRERGLACNAWVEKHRAKDWQQRGKRWSDAYAAETFLKCNAGEHPFENLEEVKQDVR